MCKVGAVPDSTDPKAYASIGSVSAVAVVQGSTVVQAPLQVAGQEWLVTCVSMGNPHAVVFGTKQGNLKVLSLLHLHSFHSSNAMFSVCCVPAFLNFSHSLQPYQG